MLNRPAAKSSILIVDDTPENIDVLKATLKNDYIVRPALNGEIALRIAASDAKPDLILLDVMMPGIDGYEVMRRLQADEATRGIPVIFITAISDMEGELKGLELGAVDYITKPINPPIVRARVQTHLALREARANLENHNLALLHERELVEDIITRMRTAKFFDDRHLRYLIAPVDRANGDILLSTYTPDGRQWVLVGDFTGHGLPAAVGSPLISYVFYSQAKMGGSIEATLEIINTVLCQQLPINIFMAACLLEVSADRKSIMIWNAGLPSCIFMRKDNASSRVDTSNLPLGISPQIDIQGGCVSLEAREGDRLYIFSDGVTEVVNQQGELFGIERIEELLPGFIAEEKEIGELLVCLEKYRGNTDFVDDITFLEIIL